MRDVFYRGNRDSRHATPARRLQRTQTPTGEVVALRGVGSNLDSWDPLFKEDYTNTRIMNTLNDENAIQQFMTTDVSSEGWQGRRKVVPMKVGRNFSTGSIGTRGALPAQGRSTYADYQIPMRDVYGRVGFEEWVIKQSRNKKGSWAEVVDQEMNGLVEDMAFRRNSMGWLAGTGILALVNGAHTATTTVECKAPGNVTGTTVANRYIQGDTNSGMYLAILDSSTQAIKWTGFVTAVNTDGTDFTADSAVTAADGDYIVVAQTPTQHSYNKEPEGILAGIDDGTYVSTYHNLSRTTYPILKSYVLTSVGPMSADAIQQPIDATSIRVGKGVALLACEHAVRRAYIGTLEPDRRYTGADLSSPDGGTKAAKKPTGRKSTTYGDLPFLVDRDAPYGMLFGIDPDSWVRYAETDGEWANDEGSVLKWVPGFDEYTAFYRIFENYHCHYPARNFRLEGITVNQIVVRSF